MTGLHELDLDVFRVDRRDGPSWVARVFPASRSLAAAAGDAEILAFLADHDFPSERCVTAEPVSEMHGRSVLLTEYVESVPRQQRRQAVRDAGGLLRLGELLGRLHTLPETSGAPARPGGAWHHLADGDPRAEIDAAVRLLDDVPVQVTTRDRALFSTVRAEFEELDDCRGLPEALVHPDYVLSNVVASPEPALVLVDWAAAGRCGRLWSLAWFLFTEGAKDLRRVDLVVAGYARHVRPEPEELSRLEAVARVRRLTLEAWAMGVGRRAVAEVADSVEEAGELARAVSLRAQAAFSARA